jgi:hypothetical protein
MIIARIETLNASTGIANAAPDSRNSPLRERLSLSDLSQDRGDRGSVARSAVVGGFGVDVLERCCRLLCKAETQVSTGISHEPPGSMIDTWAAVYADPA